MSVSCTKLPSTSGVSNVFISVGRIGYFFFESTEKIHNIVDTKQNCNLHEYSCATYLKSQYTYKYFPYICSLTKVMLLLFLNIHRPPNEEKLESSRKIHNVYSNIIKLYQTRNPTTI